MFFNRQNLVDDAVHPLEEPWKVKVPKAVLDLPKEDYKRRWHNAATRHWLLSLAEGDNPAFAVSTGNQAKALHGFFADYDGVFTEDLLEAMARRRAMNPPAYWCLSQSRQLHLVWLFERPIAVTGNVHACDLLHVVAMKVKAPHWGVGYDPDSEKVTQVMDIGREWHGFRPEARISTADLIQWDVALFQKTAKKYAPEAMRIPFDELVPELRKRYPDMPAEFREGTRCRRFWDASADCPDACLVTPDGIKVFTPHDGGFKSWPSLVGREFCDHFAAVSMAPFYEDTYYIPNRDAYKRFFRDGTPPRFESRTEKVLRREIVAATGVSKKDRDGEVSELDNVLGTIISRNSVAGETSVIYRPAGKLLLANGTLVLNTSLVTVLKPLPSFPPPPGDALEAPGVPEKYRIAPDTCAWDNPFVVLRFPFLYKFITTLFLPNEHQRANWEEDGYPVLQEDDGLKDGGRKLDWEQLERFLSWLSYWYRNAAKMVQTPHPGQALFIAGGPGIGKSFLAQVVLGRLMGGSTDAADFYLDSTRFNSEMLNVPLHIIDDRLGSSDHKRRLQFSERLKITVANAGLRYERKFGDAIGFVPWGGRVVTLLNRDPQSLSVLPDLDMSTADKFMMLMCGTAKYPFTTPEAASEAANADLPAFARFLLGYRIPDHIADTRFGVAAWQHPDMRQASVENGLTIEVVEALIEYFAFLRQSAPEGETEAFHGTVGQLYSGIAAHNDTFKSNVRSSKALRQQLQTLSESPKYILTEDKGTTPSTWTIPYDFVRKN